jgi:hypothetical protein
LDTMNRQIERINVAKAYSKSHIYQYLHNEVHSECQYSVEDHIVDPMQAFHHSDGVIATPLSDRDNNIFSSER